MKTIFVFALAAILISRLAAAPVTVGDPSFEGNSIAAGGWTNNLGPEWQETGGPNNGSGFEEYITGFAADGTDHLGMELGHDVWQDLTVTYQANTRYTLAVAVGHRSGVTQGGNQSQYSLADSTGAVHTTAWMDASTLAAGTFADAAPLVADTVERPDLVGRTIRILLQARGNGRSHFDHIRLDAAPSNLVGMAKVGELAAINLTPTSARLAGVVSETGDSEPAITIFWGPTNGGSNSAAWQHQVDLPGTYAGAFHTDIAGLAAATSYYFTVRATNTVGASWAPAVEGFETPPYPPVVVTLPATAVAATTATLTAEVTATGGEFPTVTFYYGTTDGGTEPAAWEHSIVAGVGSGLVSVGVQGLAATTTYFCRAFAENSGGAAWAPAAVSFATNAVDPPVVENRTPEGVTGTTANLRGSITDTGNDAPTVTLFYGPADGGTDPGVWAASAAIGTQAGDFTRFVSGLAPATTYYFRWRAVNGAGTSWSEGGASFTTTALVPSTAIINEFHYNPAGNTSLEEFIELYNPGDAPVDLSGWSISDAVTYVFPQGATLPARGYVVVAESPAVLQAKYGVTGAYGPWTGKLSSAGERIDLRDAAGTVCDRVTYQAGFPWPTATDGGGPSCELLHPSLDNDLGGSWRSSGASGGTPVTFIASQATGWKYKKGTAEASSPVSAWRQVAYDDSGWSSGQAGIGYGDNGLNTTLNDMRQRNFPYREGYWSVYCRKTFTVPAGSIPRTLKLRVRIDDGCVIWINGREVDRRYVGSGELPYNYGSATNHDQDPWDEVIIPNADAFLLGGTNVIAVHGFNTNLTSGDFSMDLELTNNVSVSALPTPGRENGATRAVGSIPPHIRQVRHTPAQPLANQPVTVTARITDPDGTGPVSLAYQLVDPGAYIRLTDAAYATSWTTVPMLDDGTNGDAVAEDSAYTAVLPAALQVHRRLVRYRITFADALGNSQTVPYADDEQPNFAYFVYNGVPSWTGAMRPSAYNGFPATPAITYPAELLESMPPFHLIANATDVTNCQYNSSYSGVRFRGTVVHRGEVHDHIEFRVRGIGSTYQSGKNKWNIYFARARDFQAYDNYGRPYKEKWNNLLVNANASPWASVNRGSAGVEEAVSNRIYQIGGMPSMHTFFFHLRVVDDAAEAGANQYDGDLWGLYLGLEPTEGCFLDERALPDGNIYAIEGNGGDKKHQGPTQPVDSSDWVAFRDTVAASGTSEQWYRDNVDLDALYTFLALNRLIGNVDVRPGDNYRFYHRPTDNRWVIIPYDMDMQFIAAHHWGGSMDGVVVAGAPNVVRAISRHPSLAREYRNRCREILSLMASDAAPNGGQIGQLIDEYARFVHTSGKSQTWANLDAAMWNLHPRTSGSGANSGQSSHKGNFFRAYYLDGSRGGLDGTMSTGSWIRSLADPDADGFSDHAGLMQWLVDFSTNTWPGGTWIRKATNAGGGGTDSDPNRQRGYGYKYLEFESLYGGWIDGNNSPTIAPWTDYPNKPVVSYAGAAGHPVSGLRFASSAFGDPQGAGTFAAWQWRIARIAAPGLNGYEPGTPRSYELEDVARSAEIASPPGEFAIPYGLAQPGQIYRVRVRHKDATGNWSLWSEPVQFTAGTSEPAALIHYWNHNTAGAPLVVTQTAGGGALELAGTYESGTGQGFAAANAHFGDPAASHLRVNDPLTPGTFLTWTLPTTGFAGIVVKYETRRSGQGAGEQLVSYTANGTDYLPFATLPVGDADPEVKVLDFRGIPAADDNPSFGIRIGFAQGGGGVAGNNRLDNLTVEGASLGGGPVLIPVGDAGWNFAENWHSNTVPDGAGAAAVVPAPGGADRTVTIGQVVTLGALTLDTGNAGLLNRLSGQGIVLDNSAMPAVVTVNGSGTGLAEFDLEGGVSLASNAELVVNPPEGRADNGALRLRREWSGPGGLTKLGPGVASLTGEGKTFTGPLVVGQGVLQVTAPATPAAVASVSVLAGGQLRLASAGSAEAPATYLFGGGAVTVAGPGRVGVPAGEDLGVLGALRYEPGVAADCHAVLHNPLQLAADADLHVSGAGNRLTLAAPLNGAHTLAKSGGGELVVAGLAAGDAPRIDLQHGAVRVDGTHPGAVAIGADCVLHGSGSTEDISGPGTVDPGTDMLTVASTAAANMVFVFATPGGLAGNGALHAGALAQAPATIDIYLDHAAPLPGDRFTGGLRVPDAVDLTAALAATAVRILVPDPAGQVIRSGASYRPATAEDGLGWSVAAVNGGQAMEVFKTGDPTAYDQWRGLWFADAADRANPAVSGPMADPSGSGVNNLMRYALGAGPYDPVAHLLPQLVAATGGGFVFRFPYDPAKTDLLWRVVASNDLSAWPHTLFDSATDPVPPLVDGWVEVPVPESLGGGAPDPRVFARLRVESR